MRRTAGLFAFFLLPYLSMAQGHRPMDTWALVWEDNFDFLDTTIWEVKNNWDHWGGELQVYTNRPENVFIEDGHLVLRVNREEYSCPDPYISPWHCVRQYNTGQPYQYTSGYIETKPAFNTQYGYIEARILLPYGMGFWPAFWTFKADGVGATNAAEIDIFEMLGHKPPNRITTNVHLEYCNESYPQYPDCSGIPNYFQENIIANYTYSWHTYAIEWTPTHLKWWYDDYMFRIMPNPGVVDPVRTILNMALEQGYPPDQNTPFPSDMLIDYVRVYSNVTGVDDLSISSDRISVFPVPAGSDGLLHVWATEPLKMKKLRIISVVGQEIAVREVAAALEATIDVSALPAGHYFLEVSTDRGMTTKAFVK